MDLNSNAKVMMDFATLDKEVRKKAEEYLDNISEDYLKAFAESTKFIAQSLLENYFFTVDDLYSNGALKINDSETFNKFLDFHDGYRAKMKKWSADNEIAIGEMKISPSLKRQEMKEESVVKKTAAVVSVGTLVAVGLFIFTKVWIAAAAELLALGTATYTYKKNKAASEKEYSFRVKQDELEMEKEKARLVNGLIKDLKIWLGNAEKYSNDVLLNFGIR